MSAPLLSRSRAASFIAVQVPRAPSARNAIQKNRETPRPGGFLSPSVRQRNSLLTLDIRDNRSRNWRSRCNKKENKEERGEGKGK